MDSLNKETLPAIATEVAERVENFATRARALVIDSAETYRDAVDDLRGAVKPILNALIADRKTKTGPLDTLRERIMDDYRPLETQLREAEATIKRKLATYHDEQDRIRRDAQAKADAAARKQREKLEAQARRANEAGKIEKAASLERQAAVVVAPVIQQSAPQVAGAQFRSVWAYRIVNEALVPIQFRTIDERKIAAVVKSQKNLAMIPGVEIWEEKSVAVTVPK